MGPLAAGQVVLVRFPFSDLSATKLRPAVVMASLDRGDSLLCQVTSNAYSDPLAVELTSMDFSGGGLQRVSYARPGKLFTAHDSIVATVAGRLVPAKHLAIVDAIVHLIRSQPAP